MRLMFLILLVLISFTTIASEPQIRFNQLTVEDGLSQISVNAILQDSEGFLWFGTNDGLNRYDGYQFKHFRNDPDDASSLSSSHITAIFEDKNNTLWIGTANGGLNKYNRDSQHFTHYKKDEKNPHSLSHNGVTSIIEDAAGVLWIGTEGGGLNQYWPSKDQFSHLLHQPSNQNSLSHNNVRTIFKDNNDVLWVGTEGGGLNQYDSNSGNFIRYLHESNNSESISHNVVYSILEDSKGFIWVGTMGGGLNRFNSKTQTFEHFTNIPGEPNSLADDTIWTIKQDKQGMFWIGTDGGGVDQFDPRQNRFVHYRHQSSDAHSLSHDAVRSIYLDAKGLLWIGTKAGGVNKADTKQRHFGHFKHNPSDPRSLSHNTVTSIYEDLAGDLWIGTLGGGLNWQVKGSQDFVHFKHDPKDPTTISSNSIWASFNDSLGNIWIGTQGGLNKFDPQSQTFERFVHDSKNSNSLSHNWITAIHEQSPGVLWISTRGGGLNKFYTQQRRFEHYRHRKSDPHSISSDQIMSIFTDTKGFLWVSTWSAGLNKYDPRREQFVRYVNDENDPTSLSNDIVLSVSEHSNGDIWIGTYGGGLNKYNARKDHFSHYREKDGLANDAVYGIVEDRGKNLWLSTNQGLTKFDPSNEIFRNYNVNDGLQSNEFNGNAYMVSRDGELFFGGINGFNRFYPYAIKDDEQPPMLVFTDFLLFNHSVPVDIGQHNEDDETFRLPKAINELTDLTLDYEQSLVSFEFSALDYRHPMKNQYSYKLVGVDNKWIASAAKIRRATYTNLPSGNYTLRVKASNPNGYWNEEGVSIKIHVNPPPWRTWWAYTLYSLVVFSIIGLFAHQQIKKQQVINEHNKQLRLALWGSGDELWDVNLIDNTFVSQNRLEFLTCITDTHWRSNGGSLNHIHADDKTTIRTAVNQHLDGEIDFYEATYRALTKTGNWIWLLDRGKISEYDESGRPIRFSGTTKNIHHLKTTEEELRLLTRELEQRVERRTHELKQSNDHLKNTQTQLVESEKMAALGSLVVGVSHEINTPVGIAITAVSTLKDGLMVIHEKMTQGKLRKQDFNNFKTQSDQTIELALSNMSKTSSLVEYFKQIAVDQSGEQINMVKLNQLLQDSVESILLEKKIELTGFSISCPEDITITTYTGALVKILNQLVNNTISHGYDNIDDIKISITVETDQEDLVIYYKDEGKGMDGDTQRQMYDPFYTTNRGTFIGLGMHVVYNQVCQLLQGSIKCQSKVGGGCQFAIRLPCDLEACI